MEKKLEDQIKKGSARKHKRKSRSYQEIPTEPEKFRKHVKKVFSIAGKCPVKTQILVNTFSSVQFATLASKPLPLFQLQSLKAKNCVQEHAKVVPQIKKDYGSLCKASIVMNVHWTIFNRLCKPPQKKSKQLKEQWVDIKTFYTRDNVSQELPLARAKG